MKTRITTNMAISVGTLLLISPGANAQRQMENLGRGVVAINQGPTFSAGDISNLRSFADRLKKHADPVSQFLWYRLSEFSTQKLSSSNSVSASDRELAAALIADLNGTIHQGGSIYSEQRFTNVTLSAETRSLLASNRTADGIVRLNRRLLSDVYRRELASPQNDTVYLGWRMLGTDPDGIAFNVYRKTGNSRPVKLNRAPIRSSTDFIDRSARLNQPNSYFVRPVLNGQEQAASASFTLKANAPAQQYLSIPLRTPQGYSPNDASVGDLDGDGEYEIVLHQTGRGRDNAQAGITDPPILQAYRLDGTFLWSINLGKNIREGAHYTQFMVYDLDGDGKAEVVCKTADGTVDGKGKVIGDPNASYVNPEGTTVTVRNRQGVEVQQNVSGFVLKGPEYLTVFDGLTGAALATTDYVPPRHPDTNSPTPEQMIATWGDSNGNRIDRYFACVAYLDGKQPSVVMCRGYYTRAVLAAWNWRDGKLTQVWTFDSDDGTEGNRAYRGQGNHQLSVADVDGDGKDEIVYGACVIDHDGKGLYANGRAHGDALHCSDLDPDRPGLEVWQVHERPSEYSGGDFRDAKTGELLWKLPSAGDAGRGMAANLDPRYKGYQCWSAPSDGLYSCKGVKISSRKPRSCNFAAWWDGDLLRELLDRNYIAKWNWSDSSETTLLTAEDCTSNNGTKATPALCADIFGDWREEVIWRTTDNKELRIYTTTIPTEHRLYTLMHDPQYRLAIAWQNAAYNQPPHPGFYLGEGMTAAPRPNIVLARPSGGQ